ncbi:putative DUF4340 domain-containing protein [Gammaproteobacteria bacterium]
MRISSRNQLNLVLLAMVAGLVGVVLWKPGIQSPETPPSLAACVPDAVKQVVIEHTGHAAVTLTRIGSTWRLDTPIAAPANAYRIRTLLDLCQASSHSRYPVASVDLARLGLSPSGTVVRFDGVELRLGGIESVEGQRYVLFKDTVHLVTDTLYPIGDDATGFIDPALLPEEVRVTALSLPALAGSNAVEATLIEGHWRLIPPRPDLSADVLPTLVDEWRRIRAIEVRRDAPGEVLGTVLLTLEGTATPLRFEVLATSPEAVLRRPDLGLRYVLPRDTAARLLHLPVSVESVIAPSL